MGFYMDLVEGLKGMIGQGRRYSNPTQMAKACGVAPNQILRYIKKERGKHIQVIAKILDEIGAKIVFPDDKKDNLHSEFLKISSAHPRPDTDGNSLITHEGPAHFCFDRSWLKARCDNDQLKLLTVTGDSMSPRLEDGDHVVVDETQKDLQEGRIYAVRIDREILIRRISKEPGRVVLVSDNPAAAIKRIELDLKEESSGWDSVGRIIFATKDMF